MSRPSEPILIQMNAIDFIREAAKIQEQHAFGMLQCAIDPHDRFAACEEMELWKSVQILIAQREKMQKHLQTLIKAEGHFEALEAAKLYLEEIGVET